MPTSDCITTSSCICTCTVLMKRKHQIEFMIIYVHMWHLHVYLRGALCMPYFSTFAEFRFVREGW